VFSSGEKKYSDVSMVVVSAVLDSNTSVKFID
jgi:hypothetical protein